MKKKLIFGAFVALLAWFGRDGVRGQTLEYSDPPRGVRVDYRGTPGSTTRYYWVQAVYPNGRSALVGPRDINTAATLSSSNRVTVNWDAAPGAIYYDVLRKSDSSTPSGACNCAVAQRVTGTSVNDSGQSLLTYTVSSGVISGSAVSSVFGRTGAVAATSGDYTAAQVTGAASQDGIQRRTYTNLTLTSSGTDTYAGTVPGLATNYVGACVFLKPDVANTGAASLNINTIGAEPIKTDDDIDLADATIKANLDVQVCWNSSLDSGMGAWAIVGGGTVVNNTTIQNVTEVTQEVLVTQLSVGNGRVRVDNDTGTGTEANHLASLTGAPSKVVETTAGATSGVIGVVVSGAGTTGQAQVAIFGTVECDFTNATTAGNWAIPSSTVDGECEDVGSSPPADGLLLGRVTETGAAGLRDLLLNIQPVSSPTGTILAYNFVATDEATSSTSYTDLATLDRVTFSLGVTTNVMVEYLSRIFKSTTGNCGLQLEIDTSDTTASEHEVTANNTWFESAVLSYVTSLAAGSHTIDVEHKVNTGSCSWRNRSLRVIKLP